MAGLELTNSGILGCVRGLAVAMLSAVWYALSLMMAIVEFFVAQLKAAEDGQSIPPIPTPMDLRKALSERRSMHPLHSYSSERLEGSAQRRSSLTPSVAESVTAVEQSPAPLETPITPVEMPPSPREESPVPEASSAPTYPDPLSPASSYFARRRPHLPLRLPSTFRVPTLKNRVKTGEARSPSPAEPMISPPLSETDEHQARLERRRSTGSAVARSVSRAGSPGETYSTSFVNPFKIRSPRRKSANLALAQGDDTQQDDTAAAVAAATKDHPPQKRSASHRRSLNDYLHISLDLSVRAIVPSSPRRARQPAPRTQPYGAPYFAAMPLPEPTRPVRDALSRNASVDRRETVLGLSLDRSESQGSRHRQSKSVSLPVR